MTDAEIKSRFHILHLEVSHGKKIFFERHFLFNISHHDKVIVDL